MAKVSGMAAETLIAPLQNRLVERASLSICSNPGVVERLPSSEDVQRYADIDVICATDLSMLMEKGLSYGESWYKRGGVGAFMMLARKWDRIEEMMHRERYDIVGTIVKEMSCGESGEMLLDTIADLRAYLLLVEQKARALHAADKQFGQPHHGHDAREDEGDGSAPTRAYTDQD